MKTKLSDSDLILDRLMAAFRTVLPGETVRHDVYRALATDFRGRCRHDLVRKAVKALRSEHLIFRTQRGIGLLHIGNAREHFVPLEKDYKAVRNKMKDASERLDAAPLSQFTDPVNSQMRWSQSLRLRAAYSEADTGLYETRRYLRSNPDPTPYPPPRQPPEPKQPPRGSNPDPWRPRG